MKIYGAKKLKFLTYKNLSIKTTKIFNKKTFETSGHKKSPNYYNHNQTEK